MSDDPLVAVIFKLPLSMREALDEAAKKDGKKLSLFLREMIADRLDLPQELTYKNGRQKYADTSYNATLARASARQKEQRTIVRKLAETNPQLLRELAGG